MAVWYATYDKETFALLNLTQNENEANAINGQVVFIDADDINQWSWLPKTQSFEFNENI
jgi:hypothetical protein